MVRPRTRLSVIAGIIVVSACYAVLVDKAPQVASATALGYIALILTVFVLVERWKKT